MLSEREPVEGATPRKMDVQKALRIYSGRKRLPKSASGGYFLIVRKGRNHEKKKGSHGALFSV